MNTCKRVVAERQAPAGSPALTARWSRVSSVVHPCSTATCGRKTAWRPAADMIMPWRPGSISRGEEIARGWWMADISIFMEPNPYTSVN